MPHLFLSHMIRFSLSYRKSLFPCLYHYSFRSYLPFNPRMLSLVLSWIRSGNLVDRSPALSLDAKAFDEE